MWAETFKLQVSVKIALSAIRDGAAQKKLPFLLIRGNAMILLGFARNTIDLDLLVPVARRSAWLDLMQDLQFRLYHGRDAFAQFEPGGSGMVSVDLMFVEGRTWERLSAQALERDVAGHPILIPQAEHLIALKLHAASSPDRQRAEMDWEDIRQIIRICGIDCVDPPFCEIVPSLRWRGGTETSGILPQMKTKRDILEPIDLPAFGSRRLTGILAWWIGRP